MIRERRRLAVSLYLTSDLVATAGAFLLAWYLRFESTAFGAFLGRLLPTANDLPEFRRYLQLLPVILLLWPLTLYFHGLYQMRRNKSRIDEILAVTLSVVLAFLLLSVFTAWYRPPGPVPPHRFTYSRSFLGLFSLLDLILVVASRLAIRQVQQRRRLSGHNHCNILVVGAGALGQEITQKILNHRELGFDVVAFVDDDPNKLGQRFHGVPVVGRLDRIPEVFAGSRIDQVFIALPLEAHRKIKQVLQTVAQECVEIKMVPDILQYATLNATLEDVDGTPVINLSQVPLQGWNSLIKRVMDIAVSGTVLLALAPVFPLIALAIWLEDRGPIFYRQQRMGLDGRPFEILKFRSMRVDAESTTGPVWAVRGDPRRTRVGRLLRHWSLDELPQLWNVLKGEMSIVGPRPERPAFVQEFKQQIPQYMLRHRVKAGITGWAQVHGWRGNTSIRKRLQYDLYYIENWTLKLDLKILWMTLRGGLRQTNAY